MTYTGSASEYWPPERIDHMMQLITACLSARQIGERLGISHRAVLAKCSRMGIPVGRQKSGMAAGAHRSSARTGNP